MVERDENGHLRKGSILNPRGRPKKEREVEYYRILVTTVSKEDWMAIILKAVDQAKRGDAVARKWLADYIAGEPEHSVNLDAVIRWEDDTN